MARVISAKLPPRKSKQAAGGDKTPVTSLKPLAAADVPVKFHPIAGIFDLLEGAEFDELVKDISEHGLQLPIIKHEGMILDGRNRFRACVKSGVAPIFKTFSGGDPVAYVISTNVRRRHMTSKQKQEALAKLFKLKPKLSARQAAKMVGASPTTASGTWKKLVEQGDVSNLDTSVDTKGRQQPRAKKSNPKLPQSPPPAEPEIAVHEPPSAVVPAPVVDRRAELVNGEPRHGRGSGESSTSATSIACRVLADLYGQAVIKKTDPSKVARNLGLTVEHRLELSLWLSALVTAFGKEAAS